MTKFYDAKPPYVKADPDKVLCDGYSMTDLGGCVYSKDTEALDADWKEMTFAEAEELIATSEEEATEADYIAALGEMGVQLNEEA